MAVDASTRENHTKHLVLLQQGEGPQSCLAMHNGSLTGSGKAQQQADALQFWAFFFGAPGHGDMAGHGSSDD